MKTKHTPGQWNYVKDDPRGDLDYSIYTGDIEEVHTLIADVFGSKDGKGGFDERAIPLREEAEANAKVMAAASELLKSLRSAIQALELFADGHNVSSEIAEGKEAIKKATE